MDVLWTNGLGDVIALESVWTEAERASLRTCYWATGAAALGRSLFESSARYRAVRHVALADRKDVPAGVDDWSVRVRFPGFWDRPWSPSTFLTGPAADLGAFTLPDRFVVCQHQTTLHANPPQRALRDLDAPEWSALTARLEAEGLHAVVLNGPGTDPPTAHPLVVDLVGRTTPAEGLAVLRRAEGYWGIASWLCVAAAQLFDARRLWVKGPEVWLKINHGVYFAPHPGSPAPYLYDHLCDALPSDPDGTVRLTMKIQRQLRGVLVAPGAAVEVSPRDAEVLVRTGQAEHGRALRTAVVDPAKRRAVRFPEGGPQ